MARKNPSFIGMPLPRNAVQLVSAPLHGASSNIGLVQLQPVKDNLPIRMIARKVSDIRYFPEQTKLERRERRLKEKHQLRRRKLQQRGRPRSYGHHYGPGVVDKGSPQRFLAEREARTLYLEGPPAVREISRRISRVLSGGKADYLLHILRARWLERAKCEEQGEEVKLTDDVKKVYLRLIDEILLCDSLYYSDNPKPRVEDWEYDELVMHLLELERRFPELIVPNSPSQNVGHGAAVMSSKLALENEIESQPVNAMHLSTKTVPLSEKRFPQYRHWAPMLSLDNAYRHDDLVSYFKRATEAGSEISAELKVDGVALSLEYRNRQLYSAATRGTGRIGDEVIDNVRAALVGRGVTASIVSPSAPDFLIVRGEVYITPEEFRIVNEQLTRKLSNPRNAAAGALKHKDPEEAKARKLRFIAYDCLTASLEEVESAEKHVVSDASSSTSAQVELRNAMPTQSETFSQLAEWGFGRMPRHEVCKDITEALSFALQTESERHSLPLEADGIVFKFEDSHARESAGHTARAPRGAIAYKFTAQSKVTTLIDVVMQVSRNGIITPVAVLEPVHLGGALLSRATLHNFDEINRLNVAVGDHVRVERGGDVIPKIVEVESQGQALDRTVIEPPKECPSCFGEILVEADEKSGTKIVMCKNASRCVAQLHGRLLHFTQKQALNIKGLGSKTAHKLINSGHLGVLADIFRLTLDDLTSLEGFATKSAETLLGSIQEARTTRSLECVIYGLGLPGVGRTGARELAANLKSLQALIDLASDEKAMETLLSIPSFAEKSAEAVLAYLRQERCQTELRAIDEFVTCERIVEDEYEQDGDIEELADVTGKSFVITGKFSTMSRVEAKKWIRSAGGTVSSDVSNKTDYIIVGLEPGHKYFKAQRLRVKILQEQEFLDLFKRSDIDVSVVMPQK